MIRKGKLPFWPKIGWSLFISLVFVLIYGYTFNSGDQEEHLPYVYKLLNPSLYQNDYIVPLQTSHFTIRFYYAWLLFGIGKIFPLNWAVFSLHILCLSISAYCIGSMARKNSGWDGAFILAPFAAMIILNTFRIGGNNIFDVQLISSSFAFAAGIAGLYSVMLKRYNLAGMLAGIATLFQPLTGLDFILLILVSVFYQADFDKIKCSLKSAIFFMIFSAPILIPVFIQQTKSVSTSEAKLYYDILFRFRNPHHYMLNAFPFMDYFKTIFWWLIFCLTAFYSKSKWNSLILIFTGIVIAGGVLDYVGFEILGNTSIGKIQWFKLTGIITILGLIPFCDFISGYTFIRTFFFRITNRIRWQIAVINFLLLLLITNSKNIPFQKFQHRYQIGNYVQSDLSKLHYWIANSTDLNTVILTFPDDDSFLCEAKRSMPVGYKAIIHEPFFMLPWYEKFKNIYAVEYKSDLANQNVLKRAVDFYPLRADSIIHSPIAIKYRIWNEKNTKPEMLIGKTIIHREGDFVLTNFVK